MNYIIFTCVHVRRNIMVSHLFVCEDEEDCISQFILSQHSHELLPCFVHSLSVITVHHKDQTCNKKNDKFEILSFWRKADTHAQYYNLTDFLTLCVLKVVSPEGADLVLTAHIPHSEADVLVLHCLHIKPWKKTTTYNTSHTHAKQTHLNGSTYTKANISE